MGWSGVKHTTTGPVFSGVLNRNVNVNATAYKDILDK